MPSPTRHLAAAVVVALALAAGAGSPFPPQPPSAAPSEVMPPADIILGAAMHSAAVAADPATRAGKAAGLRRFVESALRSCPTAYVALVSDDHAFWLGASAELAAALGHPRVMLLPANLTAALPGFPHRRWHPRLRIQALRYWVYARALGAALARVGGGSGVGGRDSLVLLTDTMDVAFQRDVFAHARAIIRARAAGGGAGAHQPLPPLLLAEEPAEHGVSDERISAGWLRSCVRPSVLRPRGAAPSQGVGRQPRSSGDGAGWGTLPAPTGDAILCSGTTLGPPAAVGAYIDAMVAALPLCMVALHASAGVDQSVHNLLLRQPPPGGGGGEDSGALPLGWLASRGEDAYRRLQGIAHDLAGAVAAVPVPHDWGWVCTQGLVALGAQSVPVTAWGAPGPGFGVAPHAGWWGTAAGQPVAAVEPARARGQGGRAGGAAHLALSPSPGAPPCSLAHQYDRSPLGVLVVEAGLGWPSAARQVVCLQQQQQQAPAERAPPQPVTRDCWSVQAVLRRLPPEHVTSMGALCAEAPAWCADDGDGSSGGGGGEGGGGGGVATGAAAAAS